jgi:hypothetical protein
MAPSLRFPPAAFKLAREARRAPQPVGVDPQAVGVEAQLPEKPELD